MENNKIKVRQFAASICDLFENLLDEYDIDIPDDDDDREDNDGEAHIYGITYAELEDNVKEILLEFAAKIKRDDVELDEYAY